MPLLFETPVTVQSESLEVTITGVRTDLRNHRLFLQLEYGRTVDGEWISSKPQPRDLPTSVVLVGEEFDGFIAANKNLYDQVKLAYYGLLEEKGVPTGTVE